MKISRLETGVANKSGLVKIDRLDFDIAMKFCFVELLGRLDLNVANKSASGKIDKLDLGVALKSG